jgi:hypothetical protein
VQPRHDLSLDIHCQGIAVVIFRSVPSFHETAPLILTDVRAAERFVRRLDRRLDVMEVAASSAALTMLALDLHLRREGKDNHAETLLESAYWLQTRLASLVELWKGLEP